MYVKSVGERLSLFTIEVKEVNQLLNFSLRGMLLSAKFRPFLENAHKLAPNKAGKNVTESYRKVMTVVTADEKIYEIQEAEGFTKIIEMYTIYLWSKIDNLIEDILTDYIVLDNSILVFDKIVDIKLPISFIMLDDREKRNYLVMEVKRKLNSSLKQGIGRFESLLEAFDLGGKVPKKLRDKIYELSNVRNIIVHNNSFIDEKFVVNCPNLGYSTGDRLNINKEAFRTYTRAIVSYVLIVTFRLNGEELPENSLAEWRE